MGLKPLGLNAHQKSGTVDTTSVHFSATQNRETDMVVSRESRDLLVPRAEDAVTSTTRFVPITTPHARELRLADRCGAGNTRALLPSFLRNIALALRSLPTSRYAASTSTVRSSRFPSEHVLGQTSRLS